MDTYFSLLIVILGWAISVLVLYGVIRLAVTHAIRGTRPKPPVQVTNNHLDADGL